MGAKLKNTYVTYVDSGKNVFSDFCVCAVIIWSTIGCLVHSSKVFQWFCPFLSDLELSWSIMVYPINLVCLRQIMSFKNRLSHSFSQLFFLARLDIWWLGSSMFQLSHAGALAAASTKSSCFCSAWKQKKQRGPAYVLQPGKVLRFRSTVCSKGIASFESSSNHHHQQQHQQQGKNSRPRLRKPMRCCPMRLQQEGSEDQILIHKVPHSYSTVVPGRQGRCYEIATTRTWITWGNGDIVISWFRGGLKRHNHPYTIHIRGAANAGSTPNVTGLATQRMSSKSQGRRTTRDPWDVQRALTTDTWSPVWIGNWKLWPGKHQWLENLPLVENPSLLDGNPQSIWIDLWWNSPTSWDCDNKMMIIGNSKKSWMMKKVITKNSQIYPNFMYYDNPQSSGYLKKNFFAQPEISLHSYEKGAPREFDDGLGCSGMMSSSANSQAWTGGIGWVGHGIHKKTDEMMMFEKMEPFSWRGTCQCY